jgi:hypothetical protein
MAARLARKRLVSFSAIWLIVHLVCATDAAAEPPAGANGIRQVAAKHVTLYTDLPADEEVDALPRVFDQAFPQWCAYFGVDKTQRAAWHVRAHLIKSRERFEAAGLLPPGGQAFKSGFATSEAVWILEQPTAYYRRHLLLHEGTHAFMLALVGDVGQPWYAEGVAELLATHRLDDGHLKLNYFPTEPGEVLKWGRIEIVAADYAARRAKTLHKVFAYNPRTDGENEWYGWAWATATFFDGHPRYRERFRQLPKHVREADFTDQVMRAYGDDWARVSEDWQLFVANLDYGYDSARMEIDFAPGKPLPDGGASATVAADRGWQTSGVRLEAGKPYRLAAGGRYQVAKEPRIWWCEPGGVTIRYYRSRPLGILLAAVRSDEPNANEPSGLIRPIVVGLGTTLTAPRDGTLYFRINDSAGGLADNEGSLTVEMVAK